jgi:hypothetical protein
MTVLPMHLMNVESRFLTLFCPRHFSVRAKVEQHHIQIAHYNCFSIKKVSFRIFNESSGLDNA